MPAPAAHTRVLLTLASRGDLPPRVRQLLEGVLAICSSTLEKTLAATLDDLEAQLFRLAEQSRNNDQQYRNFETLREIKRGRSDVAPRCMMAIEDCLARFDEARAKDAREEKPRPGAVKQELSLVDSRDLEESLALQEFAAKNDIRQAQTLYALGHRFAVLAGAPVFDAEALPIGPTHLGDALRFASANLDIPVEQRVLLYRVFDRTGQAAITSLYDEVNAYLIEQRVLRHLKLQAPRTKQAAQPNEKEQPAQEIKPPQEEPQAADAGQRQCLGASCRPQSFHDAGDAARRAVSAIRAAARKPARAILQVPQWANAEQPQQTAPPDERDSELFTTLRELLAGRRHAMGMSNTPPAGRVPADRRRHAIGARRAAVETDLAEDGERQSHAALGRAAQAGSGCRSCARFRPMAVRRSSRPRIPTPSIWSACCSTTSPRTRVRTAARNRC